MIKCPDCDKFIMITTVLGLTIEELQERIIYYDEHHIKEENEMLEL